ncbi:autotransporter assembly complex protein TamB [Pluralibacter gergoviae]|uniref:Autotransporter assembly complex protein TamB n=1 Tax=Pluralibacter gergoviae TaxID=61647 RepID=A0AAI9GPH3_PLUGE|nr:autotransporter assembly complex protein TamB [Pluralibacter gergoviae]EKV0916146.1 autotransporter assembly complex protein TamB [Pluralibacter gergoviae]EKV9911219.1 autotransporter assembly complex protein TamB [Pluralibacter gergoviae]EKW7276173.1 autotransporter assembly complex protein TamB [Pluralibacter gergoviae]ELD4296279.1 autotransporter assembly complex protein TamB [Pluralibacter gergoviae]ELD4306780.1 autotransporter assembly complex protein TamB [Pluralibacter gergoviae]
MSLWKKISLGALIVVVLLLATVGFLVGTTPGLHLVFKAANRWVPGLAIEQVTGGWRDLTVKNLRYEQPGVAVQAGRFHLAVDPGCLWHSSLCVNDIALSDVNVAIDSKKMPPSAPVEEEESGPLNLSTPYPITLSRVALSNINIKIDDTAVSLMDFTSGLSWKEKDLTLTPTALQGLLIALPKAAKVAQEQVVEPKIEKPKPDEKPLGETMKDLFAKPLLPEMADVHLPLNLNIQQFTGEQLRVTGDTDLTVYKLLLKVSSSNGKMTLDTLDVNSSQGTVNASGSAMLADSWPVDLTLNSTLNIDPLKGEKIKMKVGGELRKQLEVGINLSGPADIDLRARAQLAEAGLPLNLEVQSKQLYWPFTGQRQFQADNLHLRLSGRATDYALSFKTAVKGQDLPPADIRLDAKGNAQQVNIDKLTVAALEGKTELKALVDWQQAISWRSELTLAGINTAKEVPDWPSKLNGIIKTRGSLYGGSWQVDVPELKISGNVKQNKVNVDGKLSGNSYLQWKIPGLHLALGNNSADVKGELGVKDLNLDANIDAPNLDNALPGLGGTAKGLVKVRGTIEAPQLLADITARGLRWQELSVADVSVKGDVKSAEQISGSLGVRVNGITQPDVNIRQVLLDAKGSEKEHKLTLRIQGEPVSGQLDLAGSFDRGEQRWKGTLSNTRFETPVGPLALNRAVALDYRNKEQKISVGPHCWTNPNAELCVPQTIDAGASGRALVNLNRFDLAMLKPFLPPETQASGVFSGNADVSWDTTKPGLPQGKVTLSGRNVKVTQQVNDAPLPVAFDTLNVNADLHNNRAELGWLIRLTNNGQTDGKIDISDPQGKRNLAGSVNIRNFSLSMINAIFERGEKAAGNLNANLRLGGDLQAPQLFGQLQLADLDMDANFMPFDMQPSRIGLSFNGTRSTLSGLIATKQGQINLSGNADWTQLDNWKAQVAAKGSRVRITVPPMVRLDVSPDVVFTATPSLFTLDGNVDVPWARIVVHDVPESATGVSSDEVMLNNDLQPEKPQTAAIPINSNLNIHLGNNVRLSAFGLKARLDGDLKVAQDKQGLGLNGQINIPEGRFHAYGQDLIVRKGILLFSGPPDQPMLNIEAIRNPDATEDDVVAGVRVTGSADQPKAEIFSDPAMSQQEALSYLLRGQGLSSEQSDSAAMTSALVGLGVAQSGQVMGKIGETFGVSNLALDTAGVGDSSQVVVSGYIMPGLQVKYGVGIFDSLATLTLRYRLMPKLYLEAVSGIDQALDLLYQFEF